MTSWVVCPGCSLRHSARPDGVCPRCKQSVGTLPEGTTPAPAAPTPARSPASGPAKSAGLPQIYDGTVPPALLRASEAPETDKAPLGARVAGAIMIVNGLALVAEQSLGVAEGAKVGIGTSPSPVRLIFSFALGAAVLYGSTGAVKLARALVVLAGVVLPALLLSQGQGLMAALQLAYSTALLLLLFGDPGRLRIGVAVALAGVFFTMEGAGLYGVGSGRYPLARAMMAGELQPGPVTEVAGAQVQYRLSVPGSSWYLRTDAAAHKDNKLADRWLVRPDRDAHVIVIAETLPDGTVASMERFRETVVGNMKKAGTSFTVVDEGALTTGLEAGHLVHARSEVNGQPVEWLIGLYIQHPYIFQVLAFGNGRGFPDVEPELRSIVSSLEL
jgi:hypothetical protein